MVYDDDIGRSPYLPIRDGGKPKAAVGGLRLPEKRVCDEIVKVSTLPGWGVNRVRDHIRRKFKGLDVPPEVVRFVVRQSRTTPQH